MLLDPLCRLSGRTRNSTLHSASLQASEHDARWDLPHVPQLHFCCCRPVWRLLVCGRVWFLSVLATSFRYKPLILRLWLIFALKSLGRLLLCLYAVFINDDCV